MAAHPLEVERADDVGLDVGARREENGIAMSAARCSTTSAPSTDEATCSVRWIAEHDLGTALGEGERERR